MMPMVACAACAMAVLALCALGAGLLRSGALLPPVSPESGGQPALVASPASPAGGTVPWLMRVLRMPLALLATRITRHFPEAWLRVAQRRLEHANLDAGVSREQWYALQLLLAGCAMSCVAMLRGTIDVGSLLLAAAGGMAGVAAPWLWLRARIRRFQAALMRELPGYLDTLTLGLEAGCAFGAALQLTTARACASPLRDALLRCQQEIRAGHTRGEALRRLEGRLGLPALSATVAAILQADATGVSLAPVIRAQALRGTQERFARAEKMAMEAPVRMLGPLVLCIFPCTFIVVGFPIAATLFWGA